MELRRNLKNVQVLTKRRKEYELIAALFLFLIFPNLSAVEAQQLISSSYADTWVATDALGRSLPTAEETGELKTDKFVGIFYFTWHGAHGYDTHRGKQEDEGVMPKLASDTLSPYNLMEMIAENPEDPKYGPVHAFHYWGEPYFGYYLPTDEWVIRKHAQMLSDAGVDAIFFDVTNALLYLPQVIKIGEVYQKMRAEGNSTPSLSFLLNAHHVETATRLYNNFYEKGLFKDLWFNWKGKPLLLCNPEGLPYEIRRFFTLRQSWAWSNSNGWFKDGKDKWPWLDHYPQSYGWHESPDKPEQVSVSVAQHATSNIGRSFHDGKQPKPENFESGRGLYFNEQWQRALEVDPEFVFITGWNEWVAMRFNNGAAKTFLGEPIEEGETFFVDLYNEEYNRDIEPMKGGTGDNYYYQMVDNIRKFKGTRPAPASGAKNSIKIDGAFNDWGPVKNIFPDDNGDVIHRSHPGWGRIDEYRNESGRNDIVEARVAQDDENIAFYVKTDKALIGKGTENWMNLFIRIKDAQLPDWEGYHFMVKWNQDKGKAILEKSLGEWNWVPLAEISMADGEKELELLIPKSTLGINTENYGIDFKWVDNAPLDGNIMHWMDKGDAAPNGRFRYRNIFYQDSDTDGIPDAVEAGKEPANPVDSDADNTPDYLDEDSDNDKIPDRIEAGNYPVNPVDSDGDAIPDYLDEDSDNDAVPDSKEAGSNSENVLDTDGDGISDYKDDDDDNDEILTKVEIDRGGIDGDCDSDNIPDYLDPDMCSIKAPLGFSPNNDSEGDEWIIPGIEEYPANKVKVFNRWGNIIYETEGYNNKDNVWSGESNGTLTPGKNKVPDGTYFYTIDLGNGSKIISGYVIIKR